CFKTPSGKVEACFDRLEARARLRLTRRGVRLVRLELLRAQGRSLRVDLGAGNSPPPPSRRPEFGFPALPPAVRGASLGTLDVALSGVSVRTSSGTAAGSLRARRAENGRLFVDAAGRWSQGTRRLPWRARLRAG